VDQRPTYGYRRIAALLNRERRAADKPVVNAKRVHRIMGNHAMLLEKHTAVRKGRIPPATELPSGFRFLQAPTEELRQTAGNCRSLHHI
jgi:hypothetical protein